MQRSDVIDEALLRRALEGPVALPDLGSRIDVRNAKAAAVVVPVALTPIPIAFVVLRSPHLAEHAGEVGFPGGKPDPADTGLAATALRELEEEVGVPRASVDLVGELRPIPVITGRYLIHPFVGVLREGVSPTVASAEIARVIAVPLLPLLDGERPIQAIRGEWGGREIFAPHFPLDGCVLYGASAYILYELLARLAARLGTTLPEPRVQDELPWGDRYAR
jgi:8-oxo-dGTP pyrophosphatase MutT (NUDIX family)